MARPRKPRRILLFVCGFLCVLLAALYTAGWYTQAQQAQRNAESIIEGINKSENIKLTHQGIDVVGFPSRVTVRIQQPTMILNMYWLAGLGNPETPEQSANGSQRPVWRTQLAWAGTVEFSSSLFSDRFTLTSDAPVSQMRTVGDINNTFITQSNGSYGCTLTLTRPAIFSSALWDPSRIGKDIAEQGGGILLNLRGASCSNPGGRTLEETTQQTIAESGPFSFSIERENADSPRMVSYRFAVNAENIVFSPRYDELLRIEQASLPLQYRNFFPWSALEKQNAALDVSIGFPADVFQNPTAAPNEFRLNVNKLSYTDALQSFSLSLNLRNQPQQTDSFAFQMASDYTASERYDEVLHQALAEMIVALKSDTATDPALRQMKELFSPYSADQVMAKLLPALFRMHQITPLQLRVDARAITTDDGKGKRIDITESGITLPEYSVLLKGNIIEDALTGLAAPGSEATLTCKNCAALVNDLGHYARRFQSAIGEFAPETSASVFSPSDDAIAAMQSFLRLIAGNPDVSASYVYQISVNEERAFSINGKSFEEVMALYSQYVSPHLNAPSAPPPASPQAGN